MHVQDHQGGRSLAKQRKMIYVLAASQSLWSWEDWLESRRNSCWIMIKTWFPLLLLKPLQTLGLKIALELSTMLLQHYIDGRINDTVIV